MQEVREFSPSPFLSRSLAPLLLLLLLSCSLLTTDSPVTQLNFHSFCLCMFHTPIYTLCVLSLQVTIKTNLLAELMSFLIPHHPLVSLMCCFEYSVEQHPRLLQHLHRRQDVGRKKFKYATTAVAGQDIIDVRPYAFFCLSVPTTHRVVFM